MTAPPTIRFRLEGPDRTRLILASIVAVAAVWVAAARLGGHPGAIDVVLLVAAVVGALLVWAVAVLVFAMGLPAFRLGPEGLSWRRAFRWRGPVSSSDVVGIRPGSRVRQVKVEGMPPEFLVRWFARRFALGDATVVHLRSDAGTGMRRTRALVLGTPAPAEARSHLVVPGPLLATNPDFLHELRSWARS